MIAMALSDVSFAAYGQTVAQHPEPPSEKRNLILPVPAEPFQGVIGPGVASSVPHWPQLVKAPAEAPNVLLIMTDDVGFGSSSTFGGPIPTPELDKLAEHGLRYNNFHTAAMCSPSRASLLTGRNHHAVGSGAIVDVASGYPGYSSLIPKSAATIGRVLEGNGFNTAFFGKHHNIPSWENSAAGPFDHWPTGLGFEYFYGFVIGSTDQWHPRIYRNTVAVDTPINDDKPLDHTLANEAIHWVHEQKAVSPEKPFFLYYAPGSGHSPQQAPAEWIENSRDSSIADGIKSVKTRSQVRKQRESFQKLRC